MTLQPARWIAPAAQARAAPEFGSSATANSTVDKNWNQPPKLALQG
jgi:hypothetical protein